MYDNPFHGPSVLQNMIAKPFSVNKKDEVIQFKLNTEAVPALRYNEDKLPISMMLESKEATEGLVKVLQLGATKYHRSNWLKGFPTTELVDSLMRHILAYMAGEDNDQETGLPHVDHIQANALFLSHNHHNHKDKDNRERSSANTAKVSPWDVCNV